MLKGAEQAIGFVVIIFIIGGIFIRPETSPPAMPMFVLPINLIFPWDSDLLLSTSRLSFDFLKIQWFLTLHEPRHVPL